MPLPSKGWRMHLTDPLPTNDRTYRQHTRMNWYKLIPSSSIHKLIGRIYRHRQHDDLISLLSFFLNKGSGIKLHGVTSQKLVIFTVYLKDRGHVIA
jgi:hypothetical protein